MSDLVSRFCFPVAHHSSLYRLGLRGLRCAEVVFLFRCDGSSARQLYLSSGRMAQMKLVTPLINWSRMPQEYVPGKCNIGTRGRAIRLSTGLVLIALSVVLAFTVFNPLNHLVRLGLILPIYIGFLAALEGTMSFCVLHASRGTYDLHEPKGMAIGSSSTLEKVGSEEWKKLDRRKARLMHLEALAGAIFVAGLLALT